MKHNFRELKIWKESMLLAKSVYLLLEKIPPEEKFGIKSQLSRCAVSVPSNIAEGSGRTTNKEFVRFLDFSIGSVFEMETQLILIYEIFGIDSNHEIANCQTVQKMISGFRKTINEN